MAKNNEFIIKGKAKFETGKAVRNSDKLTEAVKKTGKALKDNVDIAKRYSLSIENITKRMRTFATYRIAAGVINSVSDAIKEGIRSAVDLQTEFANIQAITGSTDVTMGKLRDTILRVGQASKYSAEEIASSTVMLGQAGLSAEEINNVLETTTQLAAATGSELSNTVDLMTSSLAVWGLNSEEATHLSDVMVTGMNRTKATLETFRMAVQYAGATAASLNVNFEELAAVSSAAANAGLRASVVGTGLRAVMAELISPTKKMVEGLKSMGLTTEDVDIASRGLIPVLKTLRDSGLDASNAYDMFGRRAATFALAAQGQLDIIDELQLAFTEQGATLKAYNEQMDTISAQTTALGNTIKAICSDILESISGMIVGFLKGVNKALQGVRWLFSDQDKLSFDDTQKSFDEVNKSTKALSNYMDVLSDRMNNGEDIAEGLDETIKKLNEKFGLTEEFVKPTEDLADAWERVKNVLDDIEEKNVKNINESKIARANQLMEKELGLEEKTPFQYFLDEFKHPLSVNSKKLKYAGDRNKILRQAQFYEKNLREGNITEKDVRDQLEKLKGVNDDQYRLFSEALNIAVKARENVGDLRKTSAQIEEERLQKAMLRTALKGKPNQLPEEEDSDKKSVSSKKPKSSRIDSYEPGTFYEGFLNEIQNMKKAYTDAKIGATIAEDLADGMSDALYSITKGAKSMKDAFRDLALSVVDEIQKMITKMIALKVIESGTTSLFGLYSSPIGPTQTANSSGFFGLAANGGLAVRLRAASGSLVRGGIQGRDSVPAMLMPGEYVLKKSAVDALGSNFLNDLNNNAAQTLTNAASSMFAENPWESQESEPAVVNVWVVSKEEEAKMGPNDVIATIGKDIMTGGQTRRLIQSVVAGRK